MTTTVAWGGNAAKAPYRMCWEWACEVRWPGKPTDTPVPEFVRHLVMRPAVRAVLWREV